MHHAGLISFVVYLFSNWSYVMKMMKSFMILPSCQVSKWWQNMCWCYSYQICEWFTHKLSDYRKYNRKSNWLLRKAWIICWCTDEQFWKHLSEYFSWRISKVGTLYGAWIKHKILSITPFWHFSLAFWPFSLLKKFNLGRCAYGVFTQREKRDTHFYKRIFKN